MNHQHILAERQGGWQKVFLLVATFLALMLTWIPAAQATAPASWKESGFSIDATGMTLREVLQEFGRVYGARPVISVDANVVLKGRLKAENGTEFLERLGQMHKFRWFIFGDTVYIVSRDDNTSMRLEIGEDAVQDAKAALTGLGLYNNRFGWGELPDEGVVVVSGPRAYVELARGLLMPEEKKDKVVAKGRQVMLFRLKYASATDRTITVRGSTEVIPGVKTILSNLLLGGRSPSRYDSGESDVDLRSSKRSATSRIGRGEAREISFNTRGVRDSRDSRDSRDNQSSRDDERNDSKSAHSREDNPRIEADPSLNAIMIYDSVSKRDMYKELIAELDVEPQQIEIEALIVDLDRSRLSEMGVEWGVQSGDKTARFNGGSDESRGIELPLPGSTLLISNAARFYARLKALEANGDARVLAKPTVLTLDNVAAVLDLSQTAYLPLVGERAVDLADVTAGTKLRVVPRIVREATGARVRLEIDVEDGSLGDGSKGPNVVRSTISTQAIVDMQQTLMIGGYHAESVSKNQQKVPVLGDVPLLGGLFRNTTQSETSRERLFLITPRLVGTTGTTAPVRSKVGEKARTIAQAQSEFAEPPAQRSERAVPNIVRAEPAPAYPQPSQAAFRNEPVPIATRSEPAQAPVRSEPPQTSVRSEPPQISVRSEPPQTSVRSEPPQISVRSEPPQTSVRSEHLQTTISSQPEQRAQIGRTGFSKLDPVSGNPIEGAPAAKRKCIRPKGKSLTEEELA